MQPSISGSNTANNLLTQALLFDLSDITERYRRDYGVQREIGELHELECKKYLLLCSLFPDEPLGMKGPVDNYWHTFLLFTRDYDRFCRLIGESFIHHVPATSTKLGGSFTSTMDRYRSVFGVEPDPRAWPNALGGSDCSDGPGEGDCTPTSDCNGGRCAPY